MCTYVLYMCKGCMLATTGTPFSHNLLSVQVYLGAEHVYLRSVHV